MVEELKIIADTLIVITMLVVVFGANNGGRRK